MTIITTGSVRDIAAAFNRLPSWFRKKVQRIYINAGNSAGGDLHWNPRLDTQAYIRLMLSDLPIYWAPCFGGPESFATLAAGKLNVQQHQTYWRFGQGDFLGALPSALQNFFLHALGRKDPSLSDPVAYLQGSPEEPLRKQQWGQVRNMWSTVTLLDAAGRIFVRRGDEWATLPGPTPASGELKIFDFVPATVAIDRDLRARFGFLWLA